MSTPAQTRKDGAEASVAQIAQRARQASHALARISDRERNEVLEAAAKALEANRDRIIAANEQDCRVAEEAVAAGKMTSAMFARLRVTARGVAQMAAQVREVAQLEDPLGHKLSVTELDDGLVLYKESCPLGVVGI